MKIEQGQRYRHFKNKKTYVILAIGRDTRDEQAVVVYQAEYDDEKFGNKAVWTRPLTEFTAQVEVEGIAIARFTLL